MSRTANDRLPTALGLVIAALLLPVLGLAVLWCMTVYLLMAGAPLAFLAGIPITVFVTGLRRDRVATGVALGCTGLVLVSTGAYAPQVFDAVADDLLGRGRWIALGLIGWWSVLLGAATALAFLTGSGRANGHRPTGAWVSHCAR